MPYSGGELMGQGLWVRNGENTERVGALGEGSGMCGSQRLQKDVRKVFLWPETAKSPASCRLHSPAESTEVGHMEACL